MSRECHFYDIIKSFTFLKNFLRNFQKALDILSKMRYNIITKGEHPKKEEVTQNERS